jgi:hypothetical protein
VWAERIAQRFVVRVPAQTSNKQFLRHISHYLRGRRVVVARPSRKSWRAVRPPKQKPAPLAGNKATIIAYIFFYFKYF